MARTDPRVDAYIAQAAPFARPILAHLRKIVHTGCPEVEETIKWSFPHFLHNGMLCSMAAFKAHCAFGFWNRSLVGAGTKAGTAMGQFGRITSKSDLPGERALVALVREAAALNDRGIKPPRSRRVAAPPPQPPADFLKALRANKPALAGFSALRPSHQREYIEWIAGAKTDATRQRRMATALDWLAEGKSQNWKYEQTRASR